MAVQGDIFQSQAKKKLLEKLLRGDFALVYLNTEMVGLKLPPQAGKAPSITLKLSNNFIGTVFLKNQEIEAELLFGDQYEKCIIPYSSIWAIADTVDVVKTWKEAIPPMIKPFLVHLGLSPEGDVIKREAPVTLTKVPSGKRLDAESIHAESIHAESIQSSETGTRSSTLSLASDPSKTAREPDPPPPAKRGKKPKPGLRRIK